MKIKWPAQFYRMFRDGRSLEECDQEDVLDMLRYDLAFQNIKDPSLVAFPSVGAYGARITFGRWKSFGFRLEPVNPADVLPEGRECYAANWVTYRHPQNEQGQVDYGSFVPYKLDDLAHAKVLP